MNQRDLAGAFWSWMDCVAATLSGGMGSVRPARRVRLTEEESNTFKVALEPDGKSADAAVERIRIVGGAVVGPLPKVIAAALQGSRAEMILRSDRFLFRPLDLPKRAGEFLEGIVRSQIDRLTPWSAADAAFGWTPPAEIAKDRIALTVVATARALVAPYAQALSAFGIRSIAVLTLSPAGEARAVPVEVLQQKGAGALGTGDVRRVLVAVLVLAILSMGLAVTADQIIGPNLDAQRNDISRSVAERRTAIRRDALVGDPSDQLALERRKRETPSSVIVLEALSQILPDHTYATEFRVEGDKLQVVGITHDAPSLIRLIEQSPHFTRATFFAPTTRSPSDPGERFHIEARIKPDFTVQR
jgi:general secretion pathway protein L